MSRPAIRSNQRITLLSLFAGTALCLSGPLRAAESVCVYQSRSYSEGAFICVQKSLMQACTSDGNRLVWRVVADKDIGDRCVAPSLPIESRKRMVRRTHIARQIVAPPPRDAAKCFVFNGKRYCE